MADKHDGTLDAVRLNEDAARRLIRRATELDASLATESSVADLREAARGAGISDEAFQRALDEIRSASVQPRASVTTPSRFGPYRILIVAVVALVAVATLVFSVRLKQPIAVEPVPAAPARAATPEAAPPPRPTKTTKAPAMKKKAQ